MTLSSGQTVEILRAAGEPTRLRMLSLLAREELSVLELCRVLDQSQPRVSRHLKLLADAGLVERFPDGAWVFYRLAASGPGQALDGRAPDTARAPGHDHGESGEVVSGAHSDVLHSAPASGRRSTGCPSVGYGSE